MGSQYPMAAPPRGSIPIRTRGIPNGAKIHDVFEVFDVWKDEVVGNGCRRADGLIVGEAAHGPVVLTEQLVGSVLNDLGDVAGTSVRRIVFEPEKMKS